MQEKGACSLFFSTWNGPIVNLQIYNAIEAILSLILLKVPEVEEDQEYFVKVLIIKDFVCLLYCRYSN